MRGSLAGMRIVLLCLALGVAAIGTVGDLRAAIEGGVMSQRRALLGGDLSIDSPDPWPAGMEGYLRGRGVRLSRIVSLRTMVYGPDGKRMLVEARGMDVSYPLVGQVQLAPQMTLTHALATGLLVEPLIADRLAVQLGAVLRLGAHDFPLAARLVSAPDSAGSTTFAPTVMLSRRALLASGLITPGALVEYRLRIAMPGAKAGRQARAASLARDLVARFPGQPLRIHDVTDAAPALTRVVAQVSEFMTLIGLASLLLGGLGVGSGVAAWLEGRRETLAVLRCLGASTRAIAAIVALQLGLLCGAGILAGCLAGLLVPALAIRALAGLLPVAPDQTLHLAPLLLASGFGALVAVLFALPPLLRAVRTPPVVLFREVGGETSLVAWRLRLVLLGLVVALVALAALSAPTPRIALGFCLVAGLVLGLFRLAAFAMRRIVLRIARRDRRPVWLRLGLRALHRPGAPAAALLLALGAGLTTLASIALIEGNIRNSVLGQLPAHAPSFYFIDIEPNQAARFDAVLKALPAAGAVHQLPTMRARVVSVDGVAASKVKVTPQSRWMLRGDHGLTLASTPPPGSHLAHGTWWKADYRGPPLLSFDAAIARGWGVHLGSTITLNVQGRDIALKVASLRDIDWRSLQLNFAFIASPGLLSHAPHTLVATVDSAGTASGDASILQAVTDALPNVTGIRVADVLGVISGLVHRLALALQVMGAVALLAGALVLAATLASGQRQRQREAAILRCLGATSFQLRAAWLVEFATLGAVAGLVSAATGTLLSWLVLHYVLRAPWLLLGGTLALTLCGAVAAMLLAGLAATRQALRESPAALLRSQ